MYTRVLGMVVCWLLGPLALADVLIMNNGDRISGTVESVTAGKLLMKKSIVAVVGPRLPCDNRTNTNSYTDQQPPDCRPGRSIVTVVGRGAGGAGPPPPPPPTTPPPPPPHNPPPPPNPPHRTPAIYNTNAAI